MSGDLEDDGGGRKVLVTCEYEGELHVINITKESKISEVFTELRERWPEMEPSSTRLQYEAPVEKMLICLLKDADIENMISLHHLLKAEICNVVATPISIAEKRKGK